MKFLLVALLVSQGAVDKGAVRTKVKELGDVKTSQAALEGGQIIVCDITAVFS